MRSYRYMADVSSNNGRIDVANYSRAGHVALAVKATQGEGYVNPFHEEQTNLAHDFGLTVVHYHFCEAGNSVSQEIDHFRRTYIRTWRAGDLACFDVEIAGLDTHYANSILGEFHGVTGHDPVLYTYRDFAEHALKGVVIPGRKLWIADYSSTTLHLPRRYYLWARQYTDGKDGPEPHFYTGIGHCDGSVLSNLVARRMYIRKLHTRRRK